MIFYNVSEGGDVVAKYKTYEEACEICKELLEEGYEEVMIKEAGTQPDNFESLEGRPSTNIVFLGDWIKIMGRWCQVVDVEANDVIQVSYRIATDEPVRISANNPMIEKILSDLEMQAILKEVEGL